MKKQKYPRGWNEKRVREVIAHYEGQSEDEQASEIEAALQAEATTLIPVPNDLVPLVLKLIKKNKRSA